MTRDDAPDDPGAINLDFDIVAEVESAALPEQVWEVLWDLDRYGVWNPECLEARWMAGAPVSDS